MLAAAVGGGGGAGVVGVATTECIANKQLLEATLSYRPIYSKAAKHWQNTGSSPLIETIISTIANECYTICVRQF